MKKNTRIYSLLLSMLFVIQLFADRLTIHHIGVGQGDATLIVAEQADLSNPPNIIYTTILIDAGNSSGKGKAVFSYMQEMIGGLKHLNYVITSHLHSDHIGGMPTVLSLMHENGWTIDYIADRGAVSIPTPDTCYTANSSDPFVFNDTVDPVSLPLSTIYQNYQIAVNTYYPDRRFNIPPGFDLFRQLKRPMTMNMLAIASCSSVLNTYGSFLYTTYTSHDMDENDYSYVFLLTFQGYHYFTGGDVGGAYPYEDLETPIAAYLNTYPITDFHCCSYKASHHGSANSTNATFLNCIKPQLTVIPSALRSFNGTQLPGQSTVDALLAASSTIYFTYVYVTSPYSGAISSYNDVYLQLTDPGYGSNIPITVGQRLRSKSSPYQPTALFTTGTFTCTLAHNPPTSSLSTTQVQLIPAKNNVRYSSLSARKSRKYIRLDRKVEAIRRKQQKIMEQ